MTVSVTDRACEILHTTLEHVDHEPEQVLRLVAEPGGLTISLDEQHDDDQVIEYQGAPIMVIEREVGDELDGVTIDFTETAEGGKLTLARPGDPIFEQRNGLSAH